MSHCYLSEKEKEACRPERNLSLIVREEPTWEEAEEGGRRRRRDRKRKLSAAGLRHHAYMHGHAITWLLDSFPIPGSHSWFLFAFCCVLLLFLLFWFLEEGGRWRKGEGGWGLILSVL